MKPVTREEILPIAEFMASRRRFEADVIRDKAARRLALGPIMTLHFENRMTVWWQVQEMCRVEKIVAEAGIDHELATYNELLPGPTELSATLMIEVDEPAARAGWLTGLVGLHRHVHLQIEGLAPISARFDAAQFEDQRVSAVQFVRIALGEEGRAGLMDFGRSVSLICDHPMYRATAVISPSLRGALVEDLTLR